jgi:hypothetical protein
VYANGGIAVCRAACHDSTRCIDLRRSHCGTNAEASYLFATFPEARGPWQQHRLHIVLTFSCGPLSRSQPLLKGTTQNLTTLPEKNRRDLTLPCSTPCRPDRQAKPLGDLLIRNRIDAIDFCFIIRIGPKTTLWHQKRAYWTLRVKVYPKVEPKDTTLFAVNP